MNRDELLKPSRKIYKWAFFSLAVLLLVVVLIFASLRIYQHIVNSNNPIPTSDRKSLNFPTYYPNSRKLPVGYELDKKTISASQDVLVMAVNYEANKMVVFTEQTVPSANNLQTFYARYIPLRTNFTTPVGTAVISGLNNRTFVSLATSKTWIIITAPASINQGQLKQVLLSITKS